MGNSAYIPVVVVAPVVLHAVVIPTLKVGAAVLVKVAVTVLMDTPLYTQTIPDQGNPYVLAHLNPLMPSVLIR